MGNRRTNIGEMRLSNEVPWTNVDGFKGESFESEVYNLHGFSSNVPGQALTVEINCDYLNYITLPPRGFKIAAPKTTILFYGENQITITQDSIDILLENGNGVKVGQDNVVLKSSTTTVELTDDKINLVVAGGRLEIDGDKISTDMDVVSNGISLQNHTHGGIEPGVGNTLGPNP